MQLPGHKGHFQAGLLLPGYATMPLPAQNLTSNSGQGSTQCTRIEDEFQFDELI